MWRNELDVGNWSIKNEIKETCNQQPLPASEIVTLAKHMVGDVILE